jgi:hypothetical protein
VSRQGKRAALARITLKVLKQREYAAESLSVCRCAGSHRTGAPLATLLVIFQFPEHTEKNAGSLPDGVQVRVTHINTLIIIENKEAIGCIHLFLERGVLCLCQILAGA